MLNRIRPYYDESKEYWENGRLVGLGREGISVSLEPGGQLECSLGILHKPEDLCTIYGAFRREVDPVLDDLGFRLVNYGYQPKSGYADIPVNPKDRYKAMTAYLGRVGQFGPCMMRCSASTQVSIDYVSEQDAVSNCVWVRWSARFSHGSSVTPRISRDRRIRIRCCANACGLFGFAAHERYSGIV